MYIPIFFNVQWSRFDYCFSTFLLFVFCLYVFITWPSYIMGICALTGLPWKTPTLLPYDVLIPFPILQRNLLFPRPIIIIFTEMTVIVAPNYHWWKRNYNTPFTLNRVKAPNVLRLRYLLLQLSAYSAKYKNRYMKIELVSGLRILVFGDFDFYDPSLTLFLIPTNFRSVWFSEKRFALRRVAV